MKNKPGVTKQGDRPGQDQHNSVNINMSTKHIFLFELKYHVKFILFHQLRVK